jgi:prepilin-type N-terminal cleavage/methylation domain-containing protein
MAKSFECIDNVQTFEPPMNSHSKSPRSAFSLVELLTVLALVGVLSVAAVPAVSQLGKAGKNAQNLILLSGTLEKAREYAVSRNTYSWVVFEKLSSVPEAPIEMMTLASDDGSKAGVSVGGTHTVGGTSNLVVIDRVQKLEDCALESSVPGDNALTGTLPAVSSRDFLAGEASGPTFEVSNQGTFSHSIMFTPSGEARVSGGLPECVQLVVVPLKGGTVKDDAGAGVVRVSGLTGRVKVYRP